MRKLVLVSMAVSASLTWSAVGAVVMAQDDALGSQIPARFSAEVGVGELDDESGLSVASVEASDPRISGTWTETSGPSTSVNLEEDGGWIVSIWLHDIAIDNAAGGWRGHSEGFGHSESFRSHVTQDGETIFLVGHGAYDGLTATLFAPEGQDRGPGGDEAGTFEGVIFPVGWQPVAEPVEP